jgi:hypothetical protein
MMTWADDDPDGLWFTERYDQGRRLLRMMPGNTRANILFLKRWLKLHLRVLDLVAKHAIILTYLGGATQANIVYVIQWAEDHPEGLALVASIEGQNMIKQLPEGARQREAVMDLRLWARDDMDMLRQTMWNRLIHGGFISVLSRLSGGEALTMPLLRQWILDAPMFFREGMVDALYTELLGSTFTFMEVYDWSVSGAWRDMSITDAYGDRHQYMIRMARWAAERRRTQTRAPPDDGHVHPALRGIDGLRDDLMEELARMV